MREEEWNRLFVLIAKVVDMPGLSPGKRSELVQSWAKAVGAEDSLLEFCYNVVSGVSPPS